MKQYTVYFTEPVSHTFVGMRYNYETQCWEDREITEMVDTVTFFALAPAKKLIKANRDKYKGSCITKTWANGDWENLGEINLSGSNKTFVANTRQICIVEVSPYSEQGSPPWRLSDGLLH